MKDTKIQSACCWL